ncbi:YugN-like family protein [Neobacillus terrae]|uniref:YugN-like family protein n=1 Tax=Neobacillus terrae TaxID=3034837 RepID=UPI00140742FE|nr:YugN-like family protein [Neobacillus terrae]NHM32568.1 hypothetical protein [Neobacillus terrae]
MHELQSKIEGMQFDLYKLEQKLKPIGYTIGGNWDYDHGAFDYKINDEGSYQFVRVPFTSIDGQLDSRNCTVELGRPFILSHVYQGGLDDHADTGTFSGTLNQFSEPIEKDSDIPEQAVDAGKRIVARLETVLFT